MAAIGRRFSFTVFAFSQGLIDVEPAARMLLNAGELHPHLHTYLGATGVALLSVWPGKRLCEWALGRLSLDAKIPRGAAWTAALIGAYSHVLIDSIMHADMAPFAPFDGGNRLLRLVSIEELELICALLGLAGACVLAARGSRAPRRRAPRGSPRTRAPTRSRDRGTRCGTGPRAGRRAGSRSRRGRPTRAFAPCDRPAGC